MHSFKNCFGLIRLFAATQVLLVHSFKHFGIENWFISVLKLIPGVPIFFFISGLMIHGSYVRNCQKGWIPFYKNRFLRIYPALWICVSLSVVSVLLAGYFNQIQVSMDSLLLWLVGQLSFVQFYNPDFMRSYGVGVLNGSLWTIAVELQFYILAPILYGLLVRSRNGFVLLIVCSVLANLFAHHAIPMDSMYSKLIRVTFVPWVYIFAFGFYLAHIKSLGEKVLKFSPWIILGMYALSILLGNYLGVSDAFNPLSTFLLTFLVLQFGHWERLVISKVNGFTANTDLSYGIYLYHMPVVNLLLYLGVFSANINILVTYIVSVLCAAGSWFLVEKPSLRLKA